MNENSVNELTASVTVSAIDPVSALPSAGILDSILSDDSQRLPLLLIKAGFVADNPDFIYNMITCILYNYSLI